MAYTVEAKEHGKFGKVVGVYDYKLLENAINKVKEIVKTKQHWASIWYWDDKGIRYRGWD